MSDTQFYIRYGCDAIPTRKGGVGLDLKGFTAQYVDATARVHEQRLKSEQTAIAANYNRQLKSMLGQKWTLKRLDDFFDDATNTAEDMEPADQENYKRWWAQLPPLVQQRTVGRVESENIPYSMLNRQNVIAYAHKDIRYTLGAYFKMRPIVEARNNMKAVEIENALILPFFEMERVGFNVDQEYFAQAKQNLRQYIRQRRQDLYQLAGREFKVGQHALIKQLLQDRFGIALTSTVDALLTMTAEDHHGEPVADFITTLQEVRTLDKWYVTYLQRFERDLKLGGKVYTQINQVGTVSGRVTSDFQQFPRDGIVSKDGIELFHPRRLVLVDGGEYSETVYIDYSQVELRVQALYTILIGHSDTNLCRAYMPYKCVDSAGIEFDYTNLVTRQGYIERDWYLIEDPSIKWTPTDVHGKTAEIAFDCTPDHPDFKKFRSLAKNANFAKNYGATFKRLRVMFPKFSDDQVHKIDNAYYEAYPGVKYYHDYCYQLALHQTYATNLFGIRYYGVSGHNLINMLVQGSAAFLLKWKIIECWVFIHKNKLKSKFQMNIHDEMSWIKHKSEELSVFKSIKQIMEDWEDAYVPIIGEAAITSTTWAEKKEVKL